MTIHCVHDLDVVWCYYKGEKETISSSPSNCFVSLLFVPGKVASIPVYGLFHIYIYISVCAGSRDEKSKGVYYLPGVNFGSYVTNPL